MRAINSLTVGASRQSNHLRVTAWLMVVCVPLLPLAVWAQQGKAAKDLFVATNGNDSWSGHLASPNGGGSDGPFASINKALESGRTNRSLAKSNSSPQTIWLRSGTYFLTEPLRLSAEDSGLKIAAYKNEKPIISGGQRISNWREGEASGCHPNSHERVRYPRRAI